MSTIFTAAREGRKKKVQEFLASGADVDAVSPEHGATALFYAAEAGDLSVVRVLLAAGANIEKPMPDGATPLFIAARNNHLKIVDELIAAGALIDNGLPDGSTPLIKAAENNRLAILNRLLAAGADKNKTNQWGTALFYAAYFNHLEIVNALIAAGADVDKVGTEDGRSPLFIAAFQNNLNILNVLLAAGADVDKPEKHGQTAFMYAAQYNNLAMLNRLLAAGADRNKANPWGTALKYAVDGNNLRIVNALIAAGVDVDKVGTDDGRSPFWIAAFKNNLDIVNALLAANADKDKPDIYGTLPIHIAAQKGHERIVMALIEAGADLNKPSWKGKSVLEHAKAGTFNPRINQIIIDGVLLWEGFTQADISKFDSIFDTTPSVVGGRSSAENSSVCPVCLQYVVRGSACKYMTHKCTEGIYYHKELYDMYKNDSGNIAWCTVCGRICLGHRHYKVTPHNVKASLVEVGTDVDVDFYSSSCLGNEGGGGLPEKLARFRRMREYALELQSEIGKKKHKQAMDELVEETWNAPLARIGPTKLAKMLEKKEFNIPTSEFPNNNDLNSNEEETNEENNIGNAIRQNANTLKPAVYSIGESFNGYNVENSLGYATAGKVIYFIHKTPDGKLIDHKKLHEGVGEEQLRIYIDIQRKEFGLASFGQCIFNCGALLFPDEIKDFVDPAAYEDYRAKFNRKTKILTKMASGTGAAVAAAGAATGTHGGRRKTLRHRKQRGGAQNVFQEADDVSCVRIPKRGGGKTRRRHRK